MVALRNTVLNENFSIGLFISLVTNNFKIIGSVKSLRKNIFMYIKCAIFTNAVHQKKVRKRYQNDWKYCREGVDNYKQKDYKTNEKSC